MLGSYRAYNPGLMRFHNSNSLNPFGKGGLNAYGYCMGDPVNHADPIGHAAFWSWNSRPVCFAVYVSVATTAVSLAATVMPKGKAKDLLIKTATRLNEIAMNPPETPPPSYRQLAFHPESAMEEAMGIFVRDGHGKRLRAGYLQIRRS